MKTFQKCLIVFGIFIFAYNAGTIVHEVGHAVTVVATGGEVSHIEVSPIFSSRMIPRSYPPEPLAMSWGGFLWTPIVGVLAFSVLWILKSRWSLWGVIFAMTSLASTGTYMLFGSVMRYGDPDNLIDRDISPTVLIVTGAVLILLSLPLALPLGALLKIGRGNARLRTTLWIASPILFCLALRAAYSVMSYPYRSTVYLTYGSDIVLVLLIAMLAHRGAGWINGPEVQRRAVPVKWATAGVSLLLAVGIITGELLVFPSRPHPIKRIALLWHFADSRNYAGRVLIWDGQSESRSPSLFWRIDGEDGELDPRTYSSRSWSGAWSKGLGRLLIFTDRGVRAMDHTGQMEDILTKYSLLPIWAGNESMTRLLVAGRDDTDANNFFLLAVDPGGGTKIVHECDSEPTGMVFLDDRTAVASLNDAIVKFSLDDANQWRVDSTERPASDTKIVAAFEGNPVFLRKERLDEDTVQYWIEWEGKSVELSNVRKVLSWRGYLFVVTTDGSLYRIDSSFDMQRIAPAIPGGWPRGQGVCNAGIWVAGRDGQIRISSGTDMTVTVKVPTSDP